VTALLLQPDHSTDSPNALGVEFETHQGSRLVDGSPLVLSNDQLLTQTLLDILVIALSIASVAWTPVALFAGWARQQQCKARRPETNHDEGLDFRRRTSSSQNDATSDDVERPAPDADVAGEVKVVDEETTTGEDFKDSGRVELEAKERATRASKDKNRRLEEECARMKADLEKFVSKVSGLVRHLWCRFLHAVVFLLKPLCLVSPCVLQSPAKDNLHQEILDLEHRLQAAKRDHTLMLASSIDDLQASTKANSRVETTANRGGAKRSTFLSRLGDTQIEDVDEHEHS